MITLGKRTFGPGLPALLVAELSSNHGGSLTDARTLIKVARRCGADAVKLQVYTPDELVTLRGDGDMSVPWHGTKREFYERWRTPLNWVAELFALIRDEGMEPFASVFGEESYAAVKTAGCDLYKIASPDRQSTWAAILVGREQQTITSVPFLHDTAGWYGAHWLYCPSGYPQTEIGIEQIEYADGLSLHAPEPLWGALAISRSAWIVEAHLGWAGRDNPLPDAAFSMSPVQFDRMVKLVRETERLLCAR